MRLELVPFEDLFALEDTLVLDPSVILGHNWFTDVDTDGSILITDIQSDLAILFAPTGEHQMSYSMDTCYPSDSGHSLWASRFADDDRIILTTSEGAIVVFDRSGDCLAAKQKDAIIAVFLHTRRFYLYIPGATEPINIHHGCPLAGSGIKPRDRFGRPGILPTQFKHGVVSRDETLLALVAAHGTSTTRTWMPELYMVTPGWLRLGLSSLSDEIRIYQLD